MLERATRPSSSIVASPPTLDCPPFVASLPSESGCTHTNTTTTSRHLVPGVPTPKAGRPPSKIIHSTGPECLASKRPLGANLTIRNQNLPAQCETGWPKILLEVQDPRGPKMRVFECPRFSYTRFEHDFGPKTGFVQASPRTSLLTVNSLGSWKPRILHAESGKRVFAGPGSGGDRDPWIACDRD